MPALAPRKPERPPLLQCGFHPMSLGQLRGLCVAAPCFALSPTRPRIMEGLERLVAELNQKQIVGSLWVDGSFLTEDVQPADADLFLRIPASFVDRRTPDQEAALRWYMDRARKATHYCDTYSSVDYPVGHPRQDEWEWWRSYWTRQYGFSRGDQIKGIAVVELRGGTP